MDDLRGAAPAGGVLPDEAAVRASAVGGEERALGPGSGPADPGLGSAGGETATGLSATAKQCGWLRGGQFRPLALPQGSLLPQGTRVMWEGCAQDHPLFTPARARLHQDLEPKGGWRPCAHNAHTVRIMCA